MSDDGGTSRETERRDRVVIAAAVAAIAGRPAAVRRVRAVPGHMDGSWLREGRLAIQQSHGTAAPLVRLLLDRESGEL